MIMLVSSVAEVFSLASVLPFLAVLASPDKIWNIDFVQQLAITIGITYSAGLLMPVAVLFVVAAIVAASVRLLNIWLNGRMAAEIGSELSCEAYKRTLYQPYQVHVSRNSSIVITALQGQVASLIIMVNAILAMLSNAFVLVGLLSALIVINTKIAFIAGGVFTFAYGCVILVGKQKLAENSKAVAKYSQLSLRALQEGLGAIRDVLLDNSQLLYIDIYRSSDRPLRLKIAQSNFIGAFPRYIMEAVGLCLIASVAYVMTNLKGGLSTSLPLLGGLALGAQRILPALQQTYSNWTLIRANKTDVESVLEALEQKLPISFHSRSIAPLTFNNIISFENVSFSYEANCSPVVKNLTFEIRKGERIGFIGKTGCGKSTTIDLLMGLLEPSSGIIAVDGRNIHESLNPQVIFSWRASIAHVPQLIYLADSSIAQNIAFGVPASEIDMQRVAASAKQAQISNFIESTPLGYDAYVGERGIRLSGGQRQRIGIARALYRLANVLVFDEATSALDTVTEVAFMGAIEALNPQLTIVMIAHRLSTLARCDRIFELDNGSIRRVLGPADLGSLI
jgi:ATP-binding cassette subfamily B protein